MPISNRFRRVVPIWGTALFLSFSSLSVAADKKAEITPISEDQVNQTLKAFQTNPDQFMNAQSSVRKYDPETGETILFYDPKTGQALDPSLPFTAQDIQSNEFVVKKNSISAQQKVEGKALIGPTDRPERLVFYPQNMLWTLSEMDRSGLRSNRTGKDLWSDDYWAIARGGLAKRYADPYYPNSTEWLKNANYLSAPVSSSIEYLSPAEKYDLLVGDSTKTLTRAMLNEGRGYFQRQGTVELWMGYCHGWAAASYMLPRPKNVIQVLAADGRTVIPFYPSDIKALATLLWAKAAPAGRQMGERCRIKNPQTDANGRIIDQKCFDTNPGAWHLALVNQLRASETFAFDATFDYEVWNHPAQSYSYSYFNPQTMKHVSTLQEATVPRSAFTSDRFSRYRAPNAAYVVGVAMKLIYLAETAPSRNRADHPNFDRRIGVDYYYDIELDANGMIIGGEWYQNKHPDFVWTPNPGSAAYSTGDMYLDRQGVPRSGEWNGSNPVPASWKNIAPYSSQYSQPLARVVETLITLSQMGS